MKDSLLFFAALIVLLGLMVVAALSDSHPFDGAKVPFFVKKDSK